jgi:hypothetical protein
MTKDQPKGTVVSLCQAGDRGYFLPSGFPKQHSRVARKKLLPPFFSEGSRQMKLI